MFQGSGQARVRTHNHEQFNARAATSLASSEPLGGLTFFTIISWRFNDVYQCSGGAVQAQHGHDNPYGYSHFRRKLIDCGWVGKKKNDSDDPAENKQATCLCNSHNFFNRQYATPPQADESQNGSND